ncbi:hypothetical protein BDZ97DRAFT_2077299 [Flammula alnicola]|nr:hypothetical protein BDZ97DRAFT_2077299 [Flammula alnicola]
MSAKEFYHKNLPGRLPEIPPEIWTAIISHAIWVPGGYEPELMTLAIGIKSSSVNQEQLQALRTSLVTRRYLVRVSKAWYTLASPFLYEYILLGRGRVLAPLRDAMIRSQKSVDSNEQVNSIGWWTKRLDVSMRDSADDPGAIMATLADIMTCLPNLRILTFSITGQFYDRVLPSTVLESLTCRDTLKFVHWYIFPQPTTQAWTSFLENHPYLESINGNFRISPNSHIQLNSLKMVHVPDIANIGDEHEIWQIDLPAIRYATYCVDFGANSIGRDRFFASVGPKLTTIQINYLHDGDVQSAACLQATLDQILQTCHALEQVNLLLNSWHVLSLCVASLPPKVKMLAIRILRPNLAKVTNRVLFTSILKGMVSRNPALKIIQFLDRANVRELRVHSRILNEGLRLMESLGVIIKNPEGCIMKDE